MSGAREAAVEFLASKLAKFRPWRAPNGNSPQADFLQAASTHPHRIFRGGNRSQPLDEPVLKPGGAWTTMGDLAVGDEIVCSCSMPTKVKAIHPQGLQTIARVGVSGGAWTRTSLDHLWLVRGPDSQVHRIRLQDVMEWSLRDPQGLGGFEVTGPDYSGIAPRTLERVDVKPNPVECQCIEIACACRCYVTRGEIVTHNSGKTTVGVIDALLTAQCWHPYSKWQRPTKGWIVTLDWENGVGSIIWPAMRPWIDQSVVKVDWLKKTGVEIPRALFFPNGSEIHFRSAEATARKMQGASKLAWAWFDEEVDQPVFEEVEARLNDLGGTINVTLTPVSRKLWIRDLERREYKGKPLTKVVRASMRDAAAAGLLDQDRVDQFLASLPERMRRVRELGDFGSVEGLVWPEFSRETHALIPDPAQRALVDAHGRIVYPWPLPASWPRFASMDFGYSHPSAVPVICLDPNTERMIVERLYYGKGITANRWGTFLAQELPPLESPLVADHDAFQRAELRDCGVDTTAAIKDVVPGIEAVDRALYQQVGGYPRLMFVIHDEQRLPAPICPLTKTRSDCHLLAWEIEGYRYPERKDKDNSDRKDAPVKKDDHACFPAGTLVVTERSLEPIESVVSPVACLDPESGALASVRAYGAPTGTRPLVRVTLADGETIRCTPDHPFLTSLGWVEAAGLRGLSVLRATMYRGGGEREVLLRNLQGGGSEGEVGRHARHATDPEDLSDRMLRGRDAKRALSVLAQAGDESLPVAPVRVASVEADGEAEVYALAVPRAHNYLVGSGIVVANCDALRYLVVKLDRRRGFEAPVVPERRVEAHPVADVVPPSPWR